jgi:hypothetical protein
MQDLNQRFNSVTPQDSVSNVGAQSSAGSTELAQPMRTANAAQLSNAVPNSLNYVMPGSHNHMSHASLFQLNGRQVRGAILSSSNGERKIHFSSMCILAQPDLDKPEARRDPEHALPPAQIDDTFDVSEDAESMSPISSSSLPSPPAPCRWTFHLRLDDHEKTNGAYPVGTVDMSSDGSWQEFLDRVQSAIDKVFVCISHDVDFLTYDETYGHGVQKGVVCADEQGWDDIITMMREEEEQLGGELTVTISLRDRQKTMQSEVTVEDNKAPIFLAMLILLCCSVLLPSSPQPSSSPRASHQRKRKREKRQSNRHKPVDFRCNVTRMITRDGVYALQMKRDGVYVDMPANPAIISDSSYRAFGRKARAWSAVISAEIYSFFPVILPFMSLILYVFAAAIVLPFSKNTVIFSGEKNFDSLLPHVENAMLIMLTVLLVATAVQIRGIGTGASSGGMWLKRVLLPLGLLIILGLTCAEGGHVPDVRLKWHNATHGHDRAVDPPRDKLDSTDLEMLGSLDYCRPTDDPNRLIHGVCMERCGICGSFTRMCQGRSVVY